MDIVKVDTDRALNIDHASANINSPTKPAVDAVKTPEKAIDNLNETDKDDVYTAKIRELTSAKSTYGSVDNMSYIQLKDGYKMPSLALGTALLDPRLTKHIVCSAIDLGFRAIDMAYIYGTEKEVGEGIRAKIQDGTVKREDLFIISKLWSTFHHPDLVEKACCDSLEASGLEYFDLFLIHNPMSFKEGSDPLPMVGNVLQYSSYEYLDAWFAMEGLVAKRLVRSLGVSNFNSEQLARVLDKGTLKPVVNQVECHPYLTQQQLSEFCEARGVKLSCYGTLGSKGTPAEMKGSQASAIDDPLVQAMTAGLGTNPGQPLDSPVSTKDTSAELKASQDGALGNPLMPVMATGLGITPSQLLIRYQIERGHNVVVRASSAAHQWDVLGALNVSLTPAQVAALHALNQNKRAFTFKGMGDTHKNYPFNIAF